MQPVIEKLLILQDRDRQLRRLQSELDHIPAQRQVWKKLALDVQTEFETVKSGMLHAESDRKKLELEAETLQQRLQKVQGEQNSTRSNDQYKAYQHQIETIEAEIRRLEDRQLELMEQAESLNRSVQEASGRMSEKKGECNRHLADLEALEKNLAEKVAVLQTERAGLTADIEPSILSRYERLLLTKGDNVVVGVDRSVCGGCHMKLPMQVFVLAKGAQDLVNCPNCNRILYHSSEMQPA